MPSLHCTPKPKRGRYLTQQEYLDEVANLSGNVFSSSSDSDREKTSESDSDYEEEMQRVEAEMQEEAAAYEPQEEEDRTEIELETMDTFAWRDGADFQPHISDFNYNNDGLTDEFTLDDDACELEYFCLFLDDTVMEFLCDKTQTFCQFCVGDNPIHSSSAKI